MKAASGKEISPPVRRSVRHRAGDGAAPEPERQPAAPAQRRGRDRLAGRDRAGADGHHRRRSRRPRACSSRAAPTRSTRRRATRSPPSSSSSSRASSRPPTRATAARTCSPAPRPPRARTRRRARRTRPPTTSTRATTRAGTRRSPGIVREIGPSVPMSINVVGQQFLGDGQGAGDDKLLDVLRDAVDDLRSGNATALRGTDMDRLGRRTSTSCSRSAPPTAPRPTASRPPSAASASSRSPCSVSSRRPRTPTSPRP